jgi:hypothetical protein
LGLLPTKEAELYTMDTISIIFPQVKINIKLDNITFDTLEQMAFDVTQRIGRKVLEKALFDIDEKLREKRPKGILENVGKREKFFLTRLGDIRYKRTRYIDKSTGKARYLLEEKLGLKPNQRISLVRAKIEMFMASLTTYRSAKKNTELLTGYKRSHEAIRQSVIKESERIIAHEKHSIAKAKSLTGENSQNRCDIAYLEADSSFVRLQRRRKRKKKAYRLKVIRRRRRRRSIEIKLGIGYTDKIKRYKNGCKNSLKLKDKFIYASIEKGKTFMENLSLIAEKRLSLSNAKAIIFGGDGGAYIQSGIKDYFTGAVYILSRFHLKRNIKRALPLRPKTQASINALIAKGRIDKALSLIAGLIRRIKDRKKKKLLKELHTYIEQNKEGISPTRRMRCKALRDRVKGTGAMESNVDKFIAHRFKKRGMSWSVKGALGLLKVKEVIANDEWDAWWSTERDEPIELNTELLRELTAKDMWKGSRNRIAPFMEAEIPALHGPDRNEPWAKVLRELQDIDYYK